MKVIFAGTPEFAAQALRAILAAGHEVPLVLTQPDRPAGRGQKLQPSPVKQVALEHGIPVHQPERLKDPATHQPIIDADADVMVVAAYGLILPQAVLDIPRQGCLNIHGSLLPRWRGAAPIQRAIEAGDKESGVVIMQMEAGLDTGPMLLTESLPITDDDTAATLHDKLAAQGARLIVDALARLPELLAVPQPDEGVTYAHKIEKVEATIDWNLPAEQLARRIRAFNPFPGATAKHGELLLKCWQAKPTAGQGRPGQVLAADGNGVVVACGSGALCLTELQKPGSKRLLAADFLRGHPLQAGDRLG
jgi:methionyl-tRNA formyltransferase